MYHVYSGVTEHLPVMSVHAGSVSSPFESIGTSTFKIVPMTLLRSASPHRRKPQAATRSTSTSSSSSSSSSVSGNSPASTTKPAAAAAAPTPGASEGSRNNRKGLTMHPECPVVNGTPYCPALWGMNRIKAPQLWKKLESNAPPGVLNPTFLGAVQDIGVYFGHKDLNRNVIEELSYTGGGGQPTGGNPTEDPTVLGGHGTHVAGTAVGQWGDGDTRGIAGVFGDGKVISCNIIPGSVPDGVTTLDVIIDCLSYVQSNDAHWVSSNSWGFTQPAYPDDPFIQLIRDSIKQFVCDKGGIFVAAAGNGFCRDQPEKTCLCPGQDRPWDCYYDKDLWVGVNISDAGVLPDGSKADGIMKTFFCTRQLLRRNWIASSPSPRLRPQTPSISSGPMN